MEEFDAIVYAFTLTKSGHLRKSMISMMKEKLKIKNITKVSLQTKSGQLVISFVATVDTTLIENKIKQISRQTTRQTGQYLVMYVKPLVDEDASKSWRDMSSPWTSYWG